MADLKLWHNLIKAELVLINDRILGFSAGLT